MGSLRNFRVNLYRKTRRGVVQVAARIVPVSLAGAYHAGTIEGLSL